MTASRLNLPCKLQLFDKEKLIGLCFGHGNIDVRTTLIPERHVKLFKNGKNQAVRIPREFELPGDEVVVRKEGDKLIIEPAPPKSLLALLARLTPFDEDVPSIVDAAPDKAEI